MGQAPRTLRHTHVWTFHVLVVPPGKQTARSWCQHSVAHLRGGAGKGDWACEELGAKGPWGRAHMCRAQPCAALGGRRSGALGHEAEATLGRWARA